MNQLWSTRHAGRGKIYPHRWQVIEVVPEKSLVLDWRYGGYAGDSTVRIDLSEVGNSTKLTLTHEGQESFEKGNPGLPEFSRESCTSGWNYFIRENLKRYLEK